LVSFSTLVIFLCINKLRFCLRQPVSREDTRRLTAPERE
jgi:hypothetical protein